MSKELFALLSAGFVALLALAAGLQLVTAPVATQMMAKAAYRTGQYRADLIVADDADGARPDDDGAQNR